jgi:hypothetical protein
MKLEDLKLKIRNFRLLVIKAVINIDLLPLFIFLASFYFIAIDIRIRVAASIGIYYCYKALVSDLMVLLSNFKNK